jgi:hypothetical protein
MCKLLIIPKVTNTLNAKRFMRAAKSKMTKDERDGIGYAALTESGRIAIERWLDPSDAFKPMKTDVSLEALNFLTPFAKALKPIGIDKEYNSQGPIGERWRSLMVHTRYATCGKGLNNVHPFASGSTALIHNGVINNPDAYGERTSTCDSESILNGYIQENIANDAKAIQRVSDKLQGYLALGVISETADGRKILDIIKDSRASLVTAYIPKLRCAVFATSASIIESACKKLRWRFEALTEVEDCMLIRFDASTGEFIESVQFERAAFAVTTDVERKSLGWSESTLTDSKVTRLPVRRTRGSYSYEDAFWGRDDSYVDSLQGEYMDERPEPSEIDYEDDDIIEKVDGSILLKNKI